MMQHNQQKLEANKREKKEWERGKRREKKVKEKSKKTRRYRRSLFYSSKATNRQYKNALK
jgi:hypothetical protein